MHILGGGFVDDATVSVCGEEVMVDNVLFSSIVFNSPSYDSGKCL